MPAGRTSKFEFTFLVLVLMYLWVVSISSCSLEIKGGGVTAHESLGPKVGLGCAAEQVPPMVRGC